MKIALVGARLPRHPWVQARAPILLASHLAQRGHDVTLLCDTIEEAPQAEPANVVAFTDYSPASPERPVAFSRWARAQLDTLDPDVILSTTRLVPGHALMPVEPSASAWWEQARARGPVSFVIDVLKHTGALWEALVEARSARKAKGTVRQLWAIGPWETRRLTPGAHRLGLEPTDIGLFNELDPPSADERQSLRADLRARLDIPEGAFVVLIGGDALSPRAITTILDGLAATADNITGLISLRASSAADREATRAGCRDRLRVVGRTARLDALLAAADLVATGDPGTAPSGTWGVTRTISAALAMNLPTLAEASPATALARSVEPTAQAWRTAVEAAANTPHDPTNTRPTLEAFIDSVESRLLELAQPTKSPPTVTEPRQPADQASRDR